MQCVRSNRVDAQIADAGEHPERAECHRRDGKPAPQPRPRERERTSGDNGEIEVERPVVRQLGCDQHRCDERADLPKCSERRPVQQRGRKCCERHDAEQHEGGARHEKFVERIGRIDRRIGDGGTGGGEDARDMCGWHARKARELVIAARPLAGRDQSGREETAQKNTHARPDQPGLDRELHQENAAERERKPADPHDPARTEALFETLGGRRRLGRGRWRQLGSWFVGCGASDDRIKRGVIHSGGRRRWLGRGEGAIDRRCFGNRLRRCGPRTARQFSDAQFQDGHALAHLQYEDERDDRQYGGQKFHDFPQPNGAPTRAGSSPAQHLVAPRRLPVQSLPVIPAKRCGASREPGPMNHDLRDQRGACVSCRVSLAMLGRPG